MVERWTAFAGLTLALALAPAAPATAFDYEAERTALMERANLLKANAEELSESERLQEFVDLYFDYTLLVAPEFGTYIGHPTGHDRWSDSSLAENERQERDTMHALEVFESIDRDALEGEDRLNYDLIHQSLTESVEGMRFRGELLAISQMSGVQQNVAQMLTMMPATNLAQYENILARLNGVPELVEQTLERLEVGLEEGVTPPRVTLRDVPQQVENLLVDDPMTSPMLRAFAKFPDSIPAEEQARLQKEAQEVFTTKVVPAYRKLHGFLTESYLPNARESIAASDLPDGQDWYAYRVRQMTTTDMTPQEIHDLGLAEVKRIRAEMDLVIEESGFDGDFEAFTTFLREDPQFYFTEAEELLAAYRDIAKRADAKLPPLFGTLPRTPYGITPVPEYAQASQTTAYYQPGAMEAGRAGQFFANTYKLDTRPKWEMEALTLHEAVPGHHLQIALAQELEDLPWFRRFGGETAFVEGWGLYSESLGEEMGFYQDSYSKFGQLTYEIWRAIRLVVDTGMHSLGWSRQDAIDYFIANTGKQEHDIVVEVDRYIVWPAQALAYKIGELKIKELRAHAEQELGEKFDIRAFHDVVLGNGALPLSVLETHVKEWVTSQKWGDKLQVEPASQGVSSAALAFFVSPHGFGHAARAAAVIEVLGEDHPHLRAEIFTAVPRWFFADSLPGARFGWHRVVTDIGLAQRSAVEEDPSATADRLGGFFPFAPGTLDTLASRVLELGCRAVVADISPLGIEVARRAGIPSVLVENFTWDWIYRAYAGEEPRLSAYADAFEEIFATATLRIQTEPFCERAAGAIEVPAVARRPRSDRAAVTAALDLDPSRSLVLLNMGGFGWSWSGAELSRSRPGFEIVALGGVDRPTRDGSVLRLPHRPPVYVRDLMEAADLVVGKLGYSTVAEAVVSATRFLHVRRPASPEYPVLARYVGDRLPSARISIEQLVGGQWCERVDALLELPRPEPESNGDRAAAREIARRFLAVAGSAALPA